MATELPQFLSQSQMLSALGLKSPHAIRRMIRDGKLPEPADLGGARRWPRHVLDDLAAGKTPGVMGRRPIVEDLSIGRLARGATAGAVACISGGKD